MVHLMWNQHALWQWWKEGLLAGLPTRWCTGFSQALQPWVLTIDDQTAAFTTDSAPVHFDRDTINWETIAARVKMGMFARWIVCFPPEQALTREIVLPLAAEKNLRQVVGFEMDRWTPFAATQVYYDVVLQARRPDQRQLRAVLTVLPRPIADAILAPLKQRGVTPDVLAITGGHTAMNLLPVEQRPQRGVWDRRIRTGLVTVTLLLVIAAALLPILQQRALVIETMAAIGRIQSTANQAMALRDQSDHLSLTAYMPTQKKQSVPTKVALLRELTHILPDDTWVERLNITSDTVQIIGQSAKASALLGLVEDSPLFKEARFLSPVNTDGRSGKERFAVGARIGS